MQHRWLCDRASRAWSLTPAKHAAQQLKPEHMYCCNVQVCRPAKGPCDAKEKCDGHSKKCPDDYCVDYRKKVEGPYCYAR